MRQNESERDKSADPTDNPLIVFAGGGTGGHLYPALAIAAAIRTRLPSARFRFFGSSRNIDRRILDHAEYELVQQELPPLHRAPWRWPQMIAAFRDVTRMCREHFEHDRPAVVIGTGGISSVPAVREAYRQKIPIALHNPDALPGRANRYLAKKADIVFVQWEEARSHFTKSKNLVVSGCPVRQAMNHTSRAAGISRFDLDPDRKTLLITGASLGARTVNRAVIAILDFLKTYGDWQILHLTGDLDFKEVQQSYRDRGFQARVIAFTDHMADALAAADLVVGRAGASSLAEITAVGRASVLMPYPYHRDQHQVQNARCLVRASAARLVKDRIDPKLNAPGLREALTPLLEDDAIREAMASAARRLGCGQAACDISDHIIQLFDISNTREERESMEVI